MCAGARSTCPRNTHRHSSLGTHLTTHANREMLATPMRPSPSLARITAGARSDGASKRYACAGSAGPSPYRHDDGIDAGAGDLQGPIP